MNEERQKAISDEYNRLSHAVLSAIVFRAKHCERLTRATNMRVGIDCGKADAEALAALLVAKGVVTLEEYLEAINESMRRELERQTQWAAADSGIAPSELNFA